MTTLNTLNEFTSAAKEVIVETVYGNSWKMTSYMIQLLAKMSRYTENLAEEYPETDFYTAHVAIDSALELINNTYTVPTDDDRFESVSELYDATVVNFIEEFSDDCMADLAMIGNLCNFVCEMRVHAWNEYIKDRGPSEDAFTALKLAKRDEKSVEIALHAAAEAMFAD